MLKQLKAEIILGLFGLFLVGAGIFLIRTSGAGEEKVEIIADDKQTDENNDKGVIYVDVSGAVVNPGVVKVEWGTRIGEIISKAGGLSEDVDMQWVDMNLNMAVKAVDGQKIYLPKKGSGYESSESSRSGGVSINSANLENLESVDGIGAVTAKKIIENRPYSSLEELVSKKVISQSVFGKIKDEISLW